MSAIDGSKLHAELLRQSRQRGGYGGTEERRRVWLQLLDLEHLASQFDASTSKLDLTDGRDVENAAPPTPPTTEEEPVLLDGDGWQIPNSDSNHNNNGDNAHHHEWEADEWIVASSKRQQRRRGRVDGERWRDRSASMADTIASTGTTEATDSREPSRSSRGAVAMNEAEGARVESEEETIREERRRRRREKKRKRARGGRSEGAEGGGDVDSSGILLPSSSAMDDALGQGWVKAEEEGSGKGAHKDEQQVALDISRSFIAMGRGRGQQLRRTQLNRVITGVLRRHPSLHYYQGYHDIISVLLLVLIPELDLIADEDRAVEAAVEVCSRLSLHLLRDNLTVNMEPTMGHLKVMRNLLRQVDEGISLEVEEASALPYFALPWLISLFAHEVDQQVAVLIFDYILPRGPRSVFYLAVSLILDGRNEADADDAAEKHHALSQLPHRLTIDALPAMLNEADSMMETHPLHSVTSIMGPRSVLFTWSQLPSPPDSTAIQWAQADALAEVVLRGGTENIVIDALPTPPTSENEWPEEGGEKGKDRKKRGGKDGQGGASVIAFVGAVGAVGVAFLLMYGAGRAGVPIG